MEQYRASDGQQVYLHFLNVKMLREQSKCSASLQLPLFLEARVEDVETVFQTVNTRACLRPVAQVPLLATFVMAFVDLVPFLAPEVAQQFTAAVEGRAHRLALLKDEKRECRSV